MLLLCTRSYCVDEQNFLGRIRLRLPIYIYIYSISVSVSLSFFSSLTLSLILDSRESRGGVQFRRCVVGIGSTYQPETGNDSQRGELESRWA